jgi:hypothetical protein
MSYLKKVGVKQHSFIHSTIQHDVLVLNGIGLHQFNDIFTRYLHNRSMQKHEFPSAHAMIFVLCSIISVEILIITVCMLRLCKYRVNISLN